MEDKEEQCLGGDMPAAAAAVSVTHLTIQDVERVIDQRLRSFKAQIDLELAPLKLAIASWEMIREAIPEVVGRLDAADRQRERDHQFQLAMHRDNQGRMEDMMKVLERHLGEHDGFVMAERRTEEGSLHRHSKVQGWIKVGIAGGATGAGWFLKWLHEHGPRAFHGK